MSNARRARCRRSFEARIRIDLRSLWHALLRRAHCHDPFAYLNSEVVVAA
jgi:hypothetical protein